MKIAALFCVLFSSVCFGGECKNGKCFLNKSESPLIKQEYTSSMPVVESKEISIPVVETTNSSTVSTNNTVRRVRFFRWIRRR